MIDECEELLVCKDCKYKRKWICEVCKMMFEHENEEQVRKIRDGY
jgi:hypothetical protein